MEDNLIREMDPQHVAEYSKGSGGELDDKMLVPRSSSAMTFNILGNKTCEFGGEVSAFGAGIYSIQYEYQIPTLKVGMPANFDALLRSDDGSYVIACEMKLMEWLISKPGILKDI